ncbi:MAG: thioredoxin domain-containing protein [Bdellovibrionota bacterium]
MTSFYKRFYFIAALGLCVSLALVFHQTSVLRGYQTEKSFCDINETFNCDSVARSSYAMFLGIPVAGWAVVYYLLLLAVVMLRAPESDPEGRAKSADAIVAFSFLSLPPSLFLIGIQHFIIQKYCILCLSLDLANVLVFGLALACPDRRLSFLSSLKSGLLELFRMFLRFDSRQGGVSSGLALIGVASCGLVLMALAPDVIERYYFAPKQQRSQDKIFLEPLLKTWREAVVEKVPVMTEGPATEKDFSIGSPDALVTVIGFSDFECPFCKRTATYLEPFVRQNSKQVRYILKNFPLDQACNPAITTKKHEYACKAAMMARCAGLEGDEKFWKMHDELVALENFSDDSLKVLEKKVGVDESAFAACMEDPATKARVSDDAKLGNTLQVTSTPTIFINGKRARVMPDLLPGVLKNILTEIAPQAER